MSPGDWRVRLVATSWQMLGATKIPTNAASNDFPTSNGKGSRNVSSGSDLVVNRSVGYRMVGHASADLAYDQQMPGPASLTLLLPLVVGPTLLAICGAHPAAATTSPGPSAVMTRALKRYEAGDYHGASTLLYKVIDGNTGDSAKTRQRAVFWQGRTLYHLGFYVGSLSYFDRVVRRGKADKYYLPTLKWLVGLGRKLPGPSGVTRKIGNYGAGVLTNRTLRALRDELRLHLGRHHYRRGSFSEAARLLAAVDPKSKLYLRARLLEGMSHVRRFKARPAAAAFKAVLRAAVKVHRPTAEQRRHEELARLSLARLFYSVGQNRLAIKYYDMIPNSSTHRRAALLEQGWALFKQGAFSRALMNTRARGVRAALPEARLLAATVLFKNCRYKRSLTLAKGSIARIKGLRAELLALTKRYKDPTDFHPVAIKLRGGTARFKLTGEAAALVRAALDSPRLDKGVTFLKELDRELVLLQSSRPAWKAQPIAGVVLQDLTLHKALAQNEAGQIARVQLTRTAYQLQQLIKQLEQVVVEASAGRKRGKVPAGCDRLRAKRGG